MTLNFNKLSLHSLFFLASILFSLSLFAQTPVPPASPTQNVPIQAPEIRPRPIPNRTVGIDPNNVMNWTLQDAILAALERNVDIQVERQNVRLAEFDLFAARGIYDPTFTSTLEYNPSRIANATPSAQTTTTSGTVISAVGKTFTSETLNYNFGLNKYIEKGGGILQTSFNNSRINSNRTNLDPQYQPTLSASFTQPLLRNRKIDNNRRTIRILSKQLDVSDAIFRQRAIEIISRVQQAYWDLAFALRDEEIQREAVRLAETQLTNNQRQVEVGTLAPIDVVSAATTVETRRIQVFQSMASVAQAENAIKQLVVESPESNLWTARIVPVETFDMRAITVSIDDALKLARDNRPELRQLALQKDISQTNIEYFRNQTKPQVDAYAIYSPYGIAGAPTAGTYRTTLDANGNPILDAQGKPVLATIVDPDFQGGYFSSLRNLFTNKYSSLRVGLNISIPWKNKIAEANLGRALADTKRVDLQTRKQVQDIETQIRNDIQSIEFTKMRIDAARAAEEYAKQQLSGEEKRFAAGLSTTFFVLQRQNDYAVAQGNTLRALTDYNKSVAQLQRDIGTTLSTNNIEVKSEANPNADKK